MGAPTEPSESFDQIVEAFEEEVTITAATRIPAEQGGVQINFCKTPTCVNFGIAEDAAVAKWSKTQTGRYKLASAGKNYPHLTCRSCLTTFPIKSNAGVFEELTRMRDELMPEPTEPCCPDEACSNHGLGVSVGRAYYSSFGSSAIGSQRWKCKACGKTFSVPKTSTHRQRDSHKNKLIFKLLVNKMPLRRICEVAEIGPNAPYGKIDFLYAQCMKFIGDREAKLSGMDIHRLYLGVDRQDYAVNWTQRDDRRNTVISAVSSVDNETAYCFGLHLNFDASLDPQAVEKDAYAAGEYAKQPPFRKHAREWLSQDYQASQRKSGWPFPVSTLEQKVARAYVKAAARDDVESGEPLTDEQKLPDQGMQIHSEYTLYGHFMHLKMLTTGVQKIRFFLDQDSGMRAACLAAFADDIKAKRRVDAFFVSISKEMTVDQRRSKKGEAKEALLEFMAANPTLKQSEAVLQMIKDRLAAMSTIGTWNDRWLRHPFPDMSEPEKAIAYLTDMGDYDLDHQAWLYNKASLHGVDNLFMQIRRRLMLLERGIHSQGNAGRVWNEYASYNPKQIGKILGIFRTFHNYIHVGEDKQTPAMRLGLAKGPVQFEDVLYFTA